MTPALAVLMMLAAETPPPLTTAPPPMEPQPYPGRVEREGEPEPQHIGTTFSLYISVIEPSVAVLGGTATGATTSIASVSLRFGAVFAGRHGLLFGLAGAIFGVPGGTLVLGTFAPQYRLHFRPLVVGNLAPFLQIEGVLGFLLGGNGTSSGAAAVVGVGPGFGAEMLFTRYFGVVGAVGVRLAYVAGPSTGLASAVLWASAALAFHF